MDPSGRIYLYSIAAIILFLMVISSGMRFSNSRADLPRLIIEGVSRANMFGEYSFSACLNGTRIYQIGDDLLVLEGERRALLLEGVRLENGNVSNLSGCFLFVFRRYGGRLMLEIEPVGP